MGEDQPLDQIELQLPLGSPSTGRETPLLPAVENLFHPLEAFVQQSEYLESNNAFISPDPHEQPTHLERFKVKPRDRAAEMIKALSSGSDRIRTAGIDEVSDTFFHAIQHAAGTRGPLPEEPSYPEVRRKEAYVVNSLDQILKSPPTRRNTKLRDAAISAIRQAEEPRLSPIYVPNLGDSSGVLTAEEIPDRIAKLTNELIDMRTELDNTQTQIDILDVANKSERRKLIYSIPAIKRRRNRNRAKRALNGHKYYLRAYAREVMLEAAVADAVLRVHQLSLSYLPTP